MIVSISVGFQFLLQNSFPPGKGYLLNIIPYNVLSPQMTSGPVDTRTIVQTFVNYGQVLLEEQKTERPDLQVEADNEAWNHLF